MHLETSDSEEEYIRCSRQGRGSQKRLKARPKDKKDKKQDRRPNGDPKDKGTIKSNDQMRSKPKDKPDEKLKKEPKVESNENLKGKRLLKSTDLTKIEPKNKPKEKSQIESNDWWRRWPRQSQSERDGIEPPQGRPPWEERWDIEERRGNRTQLRILALLESQSSVDQKNEDDRKASWDNPRLTRETRIATSNALHGQTQLPQVPVPAIIPPKEDSARSRNLSTSQTPANV